MAESNNRKIIRFPGTRRSSITSADALIIDALANLLKARGYLRDSIRLIDEAEQAGLDIDGTIRLHILRRDILVTWQEIENAIEDLV